MGRPKGVISRVAEASGLDQATIRRAIKAAGKDPKTVSYDEALQLAEAISDPARVIGHAVNGRGDGGYSATDELAAVKVEAEKQRVEKMRLQNERQRGALISREDVTETGRKLLGDLRVALMAVGVRVAPRVTGLTDPKEAARIIEHEIVATLKSFADADDFLERVALE